MTNTAKLSHHIGTVHALAASIDDEHYPSTADYLQTLAMLAATAETGLRAAVAQARTEGMTWEQIGRWTGVSKQAAQQRYGR